MLKSKLMPTVVLTAICVTVALLLAVANIFTAPVIEKAQSDKANEALKVVYPAGEDFTSVDIAGRGLPDAVIEAYSVSDGGYVFKMSVTGYKSGLVIMCGIDAEGKITGSKYLESAETNGAEDKIDGQYNGSTLDNLPIILVSGSTKTSDAYLSAIKAAMQAQVILQGGSVDLRTPEQILNDSCNAAIGSDGKIFTKWFATEVLDGVDAIYVTEGYSGAVALIGESYIGIGENGTVLDASVGADTKEIAEGAFDVYSSATVEEITRPDGVDKNVEKIYRTGTGNYVFDLLGEGYGINGDWHTSGEPIRIKVALTADGVIISTLTVEQSETEAFGGACADPSYYEQYNGKTEGTLDGVEGISGATITSKGYKEAIKLAFDTLKILKGGTAS